MLAIKMETFIVLDNRWREQMVRFIVKGINDDKSFCECCGKNGLQRVVWIEDTETGEIKHFGTSCAQKPAKGFDCVAEIKSAIKQAKEDEKRIVSNAMYRYRKVYNGQMISMTVEVGYPCSKVADWDLWQKCLQEARLW